MTDGLSPVPHSRIAQVTLPTHRMVPAEQYHFSLELFSGGEGNARLFMSASLHDNSVGEKRLMLANPQLSRVELLLKGCAMGRPLPSPAEETVAVARIVPNAMSVHQQMRYIWCVRRHRRRLRLRCWTVSAVQ